MNNRRSKSGRQTFICEIVDKIEVSNLCKILKIKVTKELARQLREPGAYVFLGNESSSHHFDTPMSIRDVDEQNGYIYIAYQTVGCKTKMLDKIDKQIIVRGP